MARIPGIHLTRSLLLALLEPGQWRHIAAWLGSQRRSDPLSRPRPWLPYVVTRELLRRLPVGSKVFEYGSGSSTLFWLSRGFSCVSVEHDAAWHALVAPRCAALGGRLLLRPAEPGLPAGAFPADPHAYASEDAAYQGMNFRTYASVIDEFADASLDLVVVDGRARPACLRHAIPKLRRGGVLVLDNSDREYYLTATLPLLGGFSRQTLRGLTPGLVQWSQSTLFTRD